MDRIFNHVSNSTLTLQKNHQFQFALRHALEIYKSNSIYSFIPKNACSTMRYSIAKSNGFIDNESDIHWIHANNQTFNPNLKSLANAKYTFVILRCPFSRLASVFLDKFVSQTPDSYQYYSNTGRETNPMELTFRKFVTSLSKLVILKSNIHWRPQVDFLIYKNYDDYFAIENFGEIEEKLQKKIGLKIHDARKLTNNGLDSLDFIKEDSNNSDLSVIELINMKIENNIIPPRTLYDKEIYSMVSNIYSLDIDLYSNKFGKLNMLKHR